MKTSILPGLLALLLLITAHSFANNTISYTQEIMARKSTWNFSTHFVEPQGWSAKDIKSFADDLNQPLPNHYFSCKDRSKCPEAIAEVQISGAECSGFLVAKDILATNRHCLSNGFLGSVANEGCLGGLQIYFPKTQNKNAEVAFCGAVIGVSRDTQFDDAKIWSADFAFIRLRKPVDRLPFQISRHGFQPNSTVYVVQNDRKFHDPDVPGARSLVITPCFVATNSRLYPGFKNPNQKIFELSDCPIGPGDSGSPVLDSSGYVIGIIGGNHGNDIVWGMNALLRDKFHLMASGVAPLGWGTNFACIPSPYPTNDTLPDECNLSSANYAGHVDLTPAQLTSISSELTTWSDLSSLANWTYEEFHQKEMNLQGIYFPAPVCLKLNNKGHYQIKLPYWGLALDRHLQFLPATRHLGEFQATITVTPSSKKQIQHIKIEASPFDFALDSEVIFEKNISICN